MAYHPNFSTSIFESLGVLSSFGISETIWEKYEKFAVAKIKESTLKLRGSIYYIKDLTPKQASKELGSISPLIPVLSKLRKAMEPIDDAAFHKFKTVAVDFFDTVDFLHAGLRDIAEVNSAYELSKPVLSTDWDSEEDEHWNHY